MTGVYDRPLYYEIAFSFFDPRRQADRIEALLGRASRRKVRRILDLGCGPSLQLREFARRGYSCVGLDRNPAMLRYLRERAAAEEVRIEAVRGDFTRFRISPRADFSMIMMGTIGAISSNRGFRAHLDSVAASLNPGGLHLIENFPFLRAGIGKSYGEAWTSRRGGIRVRTTYAVELADPFRQVSRETIRSEVTDGHRRHSFVERNLVKSYAPQELLALLDLDGRFDFVGVFDRGTLRPNRELQGINWVVLRRRTR